LTAKAQGDDCKTNSGRSTVDCLHSIIDLEQVAVRREHGDGAIVTRGHDVTLCTRVFNTIEGESTSQPKCSRIMRFVRYGSKHAGTLTLANKQVVAPRTMTARKSGRLQTSHSHTHTHEQSPKRMSATLGYRLIGSLFWRDLPNVSLSGNTSCHGKALVSIFQQLCVSLATWLLVCDVACMFSLVT
jgi:hypothetical protein